MEKTENMSTSNRTIDRRELIGPFDIIGDVHGCWDELTELLNDLDYRLTQNEQGEYDAYHPEGRTAVFVGDLTDRGPDSAAVLNLVINMVQNNAALCVMGNHDNKLFRTLLGNPTKQSPALHQP